MSMHNRSQHLRLVGHDDREAMTIWKREASARAAIETENRNAAVAPDLSPTDPRWVLAVRTQSQLEGSTLTPERRARLLRTADALGIRPFDANVIVAIVQDRARRHEPLANARDLIALAPGAGKANVLGRAALLWRLLLALAIGAVLAIAIGRWILAG